MSTHVSQLLQAWNDGDSKARERLMPLVFQDLKKLARRHYQREQPGHTLQPTALVAELYMKLKGQRRVQWRNRQEFFAVSSSLIRRILVDHARKHQAAKRGDGGPRISFEEALGWTVEEPHLLALDDALKDLERADPRGSKVVELHVFGGLKFEEISEIIGVGRSTVLRDWKHSRLWLRRQLSDFGPRTTADVHRPSVEDARKRHGELVDKKFTASLTADEERELSEVEQLLDRADAAIYEPVKQRLRAEVERLSAQPREGDPR